MIPPPIVQSRYIAQKDPVAQSVFVDKPTEIEDKQQGIEADVQFLLDAQAEGLIRGLEGRSVENQSSTGSSTPTIYSVRGSMAGRPRRPPRRQPGLRSARKGIYNSIIALATLKDEELQDVRSEFKETEGNLRQIETWEKKRAGLLEASSRVDSEEETVRVQRLKQEADTLQAEINQVELSLVDMKNKHRKLLRQIAAVENAVQARIASYTESLRLLESDVEKFLRVSPDSPSTKTTRPMAKASIWQLPPQRRNLELAKEYWCERREQADHRKKGVEFEKSALVDGAELWRQAVVEVTEFEKQLRAEMATLRPSSPGSQSAWEDPPNTNADHTEGMHGVLDKIDRVAESLHAKLQRAEESNWKLLQAAIGAELDALSRGKQIIASALTAADDSIAETDLRKGDAGEEINALDQSFATARHIDDEDEEPPPELLFSQARDVDTE
ncbi:hypothetical protein CERZMDRAFT_44542 [Cercospora zeae-maydis SCOH1-5]|uniref:Uncharacterized protein n=1 Tax=Cercospora zeae-maydis SCOH1-5 TaxID=717836 RepID=A0A6A6FBU7_9PEZI|nr:hypothetical protein CERZMDRAFT_44542 [Cercospora zeae-maydis SCOH1-5]